MNKDCEIEILDEVNIRLNGLDVVTRRHISNKLKYFVPHAKHTPAYKLGRWDGYERFCNIGGGTYFNLLDKVVPLLQDSGYYITINDKRNFYEFDFGQIDKDTFSDVLWPKGHTCEGQSIVLRDHQIEIVNAYLSNLQALQEIATGAGKTLITAALSKKAEKYGRTIVIVPSKDLVTQTEADYINLGLDVGVYYGERKEPNHKHVICTWQSIEALDKKSKKTKRVKNMTQLLKLRI
jgi:hypothetical protein